MYRRWKDDPNDMTPGTIKKERRQVERAEKGLRGYEFGEKIAQRVAERFRREGIDPAEMSKALAGGNSSVPHRVVHATREVLAAATPMSLLGQPPTPISPPLLAFPTPSLQETELNSLAHPPPDVKVFKPILRPVDFEGEPSPLPLQPEEPPPKNISESSDYFGIRKRRKSLQRTASTSQVMPDQDPIQTRNRESGVAIPRDSPEDAVKAPTKHVIEQNRRYSDLFLFILVGRPVPNVGLDRGFSSIGGLLGMLLHLIGFTAFVAVHSWALVVSFVLTSRSISYFLHWTYLNLSGQTDLSIVLKDYFKLCRHEWDIVYAEDGQRLSAWSVALGLLELMAIQASEHCLESVQMMHSLISVEQCRKSDGWLKVQAISSCSRDKQIHFHRLYLLRQIRLSGRNPLDYRDDARSGDGLQPELLRAIGNLGTWTTRLAKVYWSPEAETASWKVVF